MNGCGCLDTRVFGHVCGLHGLPERGWRNGWRDLPALADARPRPEPYTEPTDGCGHGHRLLRHYARVMTRGRL